MRLDKYSPVFMKRHFNQYLYEAQLLNQEELYKKENKWNLKYEIDVQKNINQVFHSITSSKVKGFMWLFFNHALPVKGRWYGSNDQECASCHKEETIMHALWECNLAKDTFDYINKECVYRGLTSLTNNTFENIFNIWEENINEICCQAIYYITLYQIWLRRNDTLYKKIEDILPQTLANRCWFTLEASIKAKIFELNKKKNWWKHQTKVGNVSKDESTKKIQMIKADVKKYLTIINPTIIPKWESIPDYLLTDPFDTQKDFISFISTSEEAYTDKKWRLLATNPPNIKE
jgi:hypothetical protein